MAIPRDTRQAQLQTPKVAEGKAVDASKRVAGAYQPTINLTKQASDTGGNILNFLQKEERATAMYDAQNAANEYIQERQKLDEWFETQTYDEARKSLPRYYTEAQKLHDKFVGSIDKIKVADIREGFRQKINGFNQSQSNQIEAFVYKQKKEAEDLSMKSSLNLGSQEAARVVSPTATAENNWKAISASMQPYMAQYNEYMENNNIPQEAREVFRQQWINNTLNMAVNNMSTKVDKNGIDPYKDVHDFAVQARPIMSEDTWQEMITGLEKQRLDLAFDKNPEQFEANGKFNDSIAAYYAPNMNTEARRKHIKQVSAGNAANGGVGGAKAAEANDLYLSSLREKFTDSGLQWLYDQMLPEYAVPTDVEDRKSQDKRFDRMFRDNPSKLFDLMTELYNYNRDVIAYNVELQDAIIPNSTSQAEQLQGQKYEILSLKGQNTPETNRKLKALFRNLTGAVKTRAGDEKFWDFMNHAFSSETATFNDVLSSAMFNANGAANGKEGLFRRIGRKVDIFNLMDLKRTGVNGETLMTSTLAGIGKAYQEIDKINSEINRHNSMPENAHNQWDIIDINNVGTSNFDDFISNLDEQCKRQGFEDRNDFYSSRILGQYFFGASAALGTSVNKLKTDSLENSTIQNMVNMLSPEYNWNQVGKDFSTVYEQEKNKAQETYIVAEYMSSPISAGNDMYTNPKIASALAKRRMASIEYEQEKTRVQNKADKTGKQQVFEWTNPITKKKSREVILPSYLGQKDESGNEITIDAEEYAPLVGLVDYEEQERNLRDLAEGKTILIRGK